MTIHTPQASALRWPLHKYRRVSVARKLIGLALAAIPIASFCREATPTQVNEVDQRVTAILSEMTLSEKLDLLSGVGRGELRGVPRLGVPPMTTADGPFGIRNFSRSTAFPGGIALAATWNTELTQRVGMQIGHDARARGVHFYLGPGVNIYRSPLAGRNWEYFGEDPYLASRLAVSVIKGVQSQGVAAVVKHFLGNNSEYDRRNLDSVIDERTAREIYLPAFEAAVKEADVAAVMDGYNLVNGEHMTQNRHFNVDVLKEWAFRGIVMSDWGATHNTSAALSGGLDVEMPSGKYFTRELLEPLIREGKVPLQSINEKVRRILRTAVRLGWLDRAQLDTSISRYDAAGNGVALQTAQEAIVLLKNDGVLPLDKTQVRSIAVIGPNAYPAPYAGGGSANLAPWYATSLLEGLSHEAPELQVEYARGISDLGHLAAATLFTTEPGGGQPGLQVEVFGSLDFSGPTTTRVDRNINQSVQDLAPLISGDRPFDPSMFTPVRDVSSRWTGYYTPGEEGSYDVFVQVDSFVPTTGYRLYLDDTLVADHWTRSTALLQTVRVSMDVRPHKVVLEYRGNVGGVLGPAPFVRLGNVRVSEWVDATAKQIAARADASIVAVVFDSTSDA